MKIAAIQMNSTNDLNKNLDLASQLIQQAQRREAQMAILPECFAFMAADHHERLQYAQSADGDSVILSRMSELARSARMWILAAGIFMREAEAAKVSNTSLLFDALGGIVARYDKINLFDIQLPDGESYAESSYTIAGEQAVAVDTPAGKAGLTVCFDVRFPSLYRHLAALGAIWYTVPSAFSYTTGRDHWEVLLRARAIENRAYVVAPAQWGEHPGGRRTYGHSMIVDPWGHFTVCEHPANDVLIADICADQVQEIRSRFKHCESGGFA